MDSGQRNQLSLRTGEDLCDLEGLTEEPLDLTGASDGQLVVLRQLIHTEDSDDILQRLVILTTTEHPFKTTFKTTLIFKWYSKQHLKNIDIQMIFKTAFEKHWYSNDIQNSIWKTLIFKWYSKQQLKTLIFKWYSKQHLKNIDIQMIFKLQHLINIDIQMIFTTFEKLSSLILVGWCEEGGGTEAEIQLPLKRFSRFQRLFPNPSWLVWGRASRHQKLAPTFPGIDSCFMVTQRDFSKWKRHLWLNGRSQNVAKGWLST